MDTFEVTEEILMDQPLEETSQPVLLVLSGVSSDYQGVFELEDQLQVGRSTDNDVQWAYDPEVSRQHCRFVQQNGRIFLKDLDSSNGTFVDGIRVDVSEIFGGEVIFVGKMIVRVSIVDVSHHSVVNRQRQVPESIPGLEP
ncbi:MAG: FHA domain-containing protein, partial [Proteobacteria bacterium]|nr:FHA domain-containing protein [Pseudomonadota bacterium]